MLKLSCEICGDIYKMELHEVLHSEGMNIMRVAGGWIYDFVAYNGFPASTIFIPYNNEFMTANV